MLFVCSLCPLAQALVFYVHWLSHALTLSLWWLATLPLVALWEHWGADLGWLLWHLFQTYFANLGLPFASQFVPLNSAKLLSLLPATSECGWKACLTCTYVSGTHPVFIELLETILLFCLALLLLLARLRMLTLTCSWPAACDDTLAALRRCGCFLLVDYALGTSILNVGGRLATASWMFGGTWWRSYGVIYSFLSSHKILFGSPIPHSWILNPELKDPDFNVNKQTKPKPKT